MEPTEKFRQELNACAKDLVKKAIQQLSETVTGLFEELDTAILKFKKYVSWDNPKWETVKEVISKIKQNLLNATVNHTTDPLYGYVEKSKKQIPLLWTIDLAPSRFGFQYKVFINNVFEKQGTLRKCTKFLCKRIKKFSRETVPPTELIQ
jgi:hypothetical protein